MAKIKSIHAREILNSKGNPTIETTVVLSNDISATSSIPSGTSVGSYEAVDLRDHDEKRQAGLGVLKAIQNVHTIIQPKLVNMDVNKQQDIDKLMIELDGTQNKGALGANAILSVSIACAKAAALNERLPLFKYLHKFNDQNMPLKIPIPSFNLVNGGKHAEGTLDFQEFMVIPASSKNYIESLNMATNITRNIRKSLQLQNLSILVGDEGGFSPRFASNSDVFTFLKQVIGESALRPGFDVFFGLDAAANSFFESKKYTLKEKSRSMSADDLITYYKELNKNFNLLYLEDPLFEDDWDSWSKLTKEIEANTIIVGDDLTTTNPYRLQMALDSKSITGILIKPNQIGTVIEAFAVVEVARSAGLKIIVSHRSGETNDDFIADFAVAASADYVKFGAPVRGERVSKYNRLLQIHEELSAPQS